MGLRAVRQEASVLQAHASRPTTVRSERNKAPHRGVKSMQEHRPPDPGAVKDRGDPVDHGERLANILLIHLDEDAERGCLNKFNATRRSASAKEASPASMPTPR